ncbi:MAG: DUF58 domain-containing protein [Candidatus Aureabacteria bacterium]|nr:DUF58 domain-containing protein [Candidatus Auribacterota bacterium]
MIPTRQTLFLFMLMTAGTFLTFISSLFIIPVFVIDAAIIAAMIFEYRFVLRKNIVTVQRKIPKKFSISQKNAVILIVNNFSRHALTVEIRDSLPESFSYDFQSLSVSLDPFSRKKLVYSATPEKRGEYFFGDIYVRMQKKSGFAIRSYALPARMKAKVYPNLLGIVRYETIARAKHLENFGIHIAHLVGTGREFEKLREYQKDDDYHSISWKATAKKSRPIVKEFQIEKSQSVLVCLNCGRSMMGMAGRYNKFEYALNATLMLSYLCQRFGDKIGLCLFAESIKSFIPIKQGTSQVNRIIEALYMTEPSMLYVDYIELVKYLTTKNIKRSLIIIFTDLFDEEQSRSILKSIPLLHPRHLVLCVSMKDSALREALAPKIFKAEDAFKFIAAFELGRERSLMSRKLTEKGILVLDEEAESLSLSLINKYVDIKSRQLL